MRIAFVGAEGVPYPNAFAKITEEIGTRLVTNGHSVLVFCRRRFVNDWTDYRGMKRVVLDSWNTKHLDTITFSTLATLLLLLRRYSVDLVHFHGIGPSTLSLLPRPLGMKSVVHVHGLDWQRAKWGRLAKTYLRLGEYSSIYFPNATVVVSRLLKEYFERKFGRPTTFIPQGVDVYSKAPPDEILKLGICPYRYILFMGRLVPEKGCHSLIKAYEQLHPNLQLIIAGAPAHTDDYARELIKCESPNVYFLGHVSGRLKQELLSYPYLYVQPSEMEGLSLALLEAMSYGNCVLVSDIPENLEAIGESGVTFKNKDCCDLAAKIDYLEKDPALVHEYRQKAEACVRATYNWDRVASRFEQLYSAVLQGS